MSTQKVSKHFLKCLNKNSFDLLLICFVFHIRNSLEKQTENSGVLLNSHATEKVPYKKNFKSMCECFVLQVFA